MSLLKVHLLVERDLYGNPHGSGHIRLLRPFSHPVLSEYFRVTVEDGISPDGTDVVIIERGWRADTTLESAEALVTSIRARGAKLIYTLDDNLLDLHSCQPWHEFSTDIKRNIVRFFLMQADGVIVSTEALKQRLIKLNPTICVVPNALDERLFLNENDTYPHAGQERPVGAPMIIGYMGTYSHLHDLMMVLEPLRAVLRRHHVEFQLVGITEGGRIAKSFDSLPFRILDTAGNHFYPDFVSWARKNMHWDLAIAPLEDNAFTRCKSDIKFLDYAMLGIPAIFSNVDAYRFSVKHGENGWLCNNTPQAWCAALNEAVESFSLRQSMASSAYELVSTQRLLCQSAVNWVHAVAAIAGKGGR